MNNSLNNRSFRLAPVVIMALAVFVTGCAKEQPMAKERVAELNQFGPPVSVQYTSHTHLVPTNSATIEVPERNLRDLYGFLIGLNARPGDRVMLAARTERMEQRDQIEVFLKKLGLRPETRVIKERMQSAPDDGYDNVVMVEYKAFLPLIPECGKWDPNEMRNYENVNMSNYGCSNKAALAQQAAYPQHLVQGLPLDLTDALMAVGAVVNYQTGRVKDVQPVTISQ